MSTPFKTTRTKKKNLLTLAIYLLALPKDYKDFNMLYFANGSCNYDPDPYELVDKVVGCGTVACAVGHAPNAGIKPFKTEDWWQYSTRTLIDTRTNEWRWCFAGDWFDTDNTPQGAGKRIMWLLEKGLPDDWKDQMEGEAKLSYMENQDDCTADN